VLYCTIDNIEWESGYSVPPYFVEQKLPRVVYCTPSHKKEKNG